MISLRKTRAESKTMDRMNDKKCTDSFIIFSLNFKIRNICRLAKHKNNGGVRKWRSNAKLIELKGSRLSNYPAQYHNSAEENSQQEISRNSNFFDSKSRISSILIVDRMNWTGRNVIWTQIVNKKKPWNAKSTRERSFCRIPQPNNTRKRSGKLSFILAPLPLFCCVSWDLSDCSRPATQNIIRTVINRRVVALSQQAIQ